MSTTAESPLVTVLEAADFLRLSERTVWQMIHDGDLPAVRLRRSLRLRRADLERLVAEGTDR